MNDRGGSHCLLVCLVVHVLASSTSARDGVNHNHNHNHTYHRHSRKTQRDKDPSGNATANGVTCYTCVNVSDNLVCNRYAIDRPCPRGASFCHTLHIMDSLGDSVVVNKKCADHTECSTERVGCLQIDSQKVCVSCCDEMYCNGSAPTNHSTALFSSSAGSAPRHLQAGGGAGGGGGGGGGASEANGAPGATCPLHRASAPTCRTLILTLAQVLWPTLAFLQPGRL